MEGDPYIMSSGTLHYSFLSNRNCHLNHCVFESSDIAPWNHAHGYRLRASKPAHKRKARSTYDMGSLSTKKFQLRQVSQLTGTFRFIPRTNHSFSSWKFKPPATTARSLRWPQLFSVLNMPSTTALFSTTSLKAAGAQPYASMEGKLDPLLLGSLREMGMEYMTPVQSKVLSMPSLTTDWYVDERLACYGHRIPGGNLLFWC